MLQILNNFLLKKENSINYDLIIINFNDNKSKHLI